MRMHRLGSFRFENVVHFLSVCCRIYGKKPEIGCTSLMCEKLHGAGLFRMPWSSTGQPESQMDHGVCPKCAKPDLAE